MDKQSEEEDHGDHGHSHWNAIYTEHLRHVAGVLRFVSKRLVRSGFDGQSKT
jgi:hypothetical protein